MTQKEKTIIIGLAFWGIEIRQQLDRIEAQIDKMIQPDAKYPDAGGEIIFNSGEDGEKAVNEALEREGIEVEDD